MQTIEKDYRGTPCLFTCFDGPSLMEALADAPELAEKIANLVNSQVGAHNLGSIQAARILALQEWEKLPAEKQKTTAKPEGPLSSFNVLHWIKENKVKGMRSGEPTEADVKAWEKSEFRAKMLGAIALGREFKPGWIAPIVAHFQKTTPEFTFDESLVESMDDIPALYRAKRLWKKAEKKAEITVDDFS